MNKILIRTPIFPINDLDNIFNCTDLHYFIINLFNSNSIFKESIYIYSKILYNESLRYDKILDKRKKHKIVNSLIKYYLRMCYRPTPFGICAGVSVANIDNCISKPVSYVKRSIRIDSAVYNNIINEINCICDVRKEITYYINNTITITSEHYKFIDRNLNSNSFNFNFSKVDINYYISLILDNAKNGIKYEEVLKLIQSISSFKIEEIEYFFNELIDKEIIISELNYDILSITFQFNFLEKIKNINLKIKNNELKQIILTLQSVFNIISELERLEIDSKVDCLDKYIKVDLLLKKYNNTEKTTLQIDLVGNNVIKVDKQMKDEIENNFNAFFKLHSVLSTSDKLEKFKFEFKNRYGNISIPLLKVFDTEHGIGFPVNLNIEDASSFLDNFKILFEHNSEQVRLTDWDNIILRKYIDSLRTPKKYIEITESDLAHIKNFTTPINTSILFSGEIHKNVNKDIYYVNNIRIGSAHYTAGRFSYANNEINSYIQEIVDFENSPDINEFVYAEIKHFSQPRVGNISTRPCFYDFYISIYDPPSDIDKIEVKLNDLYLTLQNNTIMLFSKKLNKRIIPKFSCAQNTSLLTSSIYNFLGHLSEDYFIKFWNWGFLKDNNHLPRVTFKNFILSKEQWILKIENIYKDQNEIKYLKEYINQNQITRYVTMTIGGDNYLPLDLQNDLSINILNEELVKFKIVYLEESLCLSVKTENKKPIYNSEVQIPFFTKKCYHTLNRVNNQSYISVSKTKDVEKKYFPSNKCIYFKIYIKNNFIDKLLITKLNQLVLKFIKNGVIDYFYFIRYLDPEYHFRLRLFSQNLDINIILNELNNSFSNEINQFIIDKIIIDTYEPEIERYGGKLGMQISEKIFFYDSLCVFETLSWIQNTSSLNVKWLIAMQGVNYIFHDFEISHKSRVTILTNLKEYYFVRIKNKNELNKQVLVFYNYNRKIIVKSMETEFFENNYFKFYKKRSHNIKKLIKSLIENKVDYELENYIHMFLNRFFENNPNHQEMIIYDLLIRYYKSVIFKQVVN